eukprot:6600019-Alexandrium_andersonii.AAC.1
MLGLSGSCRLDKAPTMCTSSEVTFLAWVEAAAPRPASQADDWAKAAWSQVRGQVRHVFDMRSSEAA